MVAHRILTLVAATGLLAVQAPVYAQFGRVPPPPKEPPAWAADLPGYWESLITQNWRFRMVTPPKGDYVGIPITAAAQQIADTWDPARDTAQDQQCRSYGAGMIMMNPEHLHVSWQDTKTLKVEIDNGTQTRLWHFDKTAPGDSAPSWQGISSASWVLRAASGYPFGARPKPNARYLEVKTTHMLPGYLRKNGVPYSANAELTEDYDMLRMPDDQILTLTTSVNDPTYLDYPLLLSTQFKKQADGSHWDPTPCSASW